MVTSVVKHLPYILKEINQLMINHIIQLNFINVGIQDHQAPR